MIWGFLKPGRLLKSITTKRKVQKTKPLASTPYLCDCKSVKHYIVQDEHQGWLMIRISAYVIEFWAFIIFISKQIHASVWAGCVPRWWHPNRQGGTSNVIQRDQEIGKRVALSRGLWDFIHTSTHTYSTSIHVLSLPLWLIVWPPVGSLASCCPVLWEITSLSSWHTRQTVFWLTYAQLLHSSFPASSAPITARVTKCYCIFAKIRHFL